MSIPVDSASQTEESSCAAVVSRAVPMVSCNTMAWTDKREELNVLVMNSNDPVAYITKVTEEKTMLHMLLMGTSTENSYMEFKWWTKLWKVMQSVEKLKSREIERAVERATKCQCKKDGC
jgi:hypothetical protein